MIKLYQVYLIKLFLKKIIYISGLFILLILILSVFDEISYFKNHNVNIFFPFLMTILNAPSALFEIFPFIFLISAQFFFLELIKKKELETFKSKGLSNFKILKILFLTSLTLGILIITIFYHFSSKFQFTYFQLKNNYSNDNKYLAAVTENGLWIKDEIDNKKIIINASKIEKNYLKNVTISEFTENYDLIKIIESSKVDIASKNWVIFKPIISKDNLTEVNDQNIVISTHFDQNKINSMFRNLTSLNFFELKQLMKDYELLGYSTSEIKIHLHRLFSIPFYVSIMTIISGIIMLNIKRNKSMLFHIGSAILFSVLIYYLSYMFVILGENEKIPLITSIWLPLFMLIGFILIGLVRINEK
jgi:lipopolysaccharide export system permease protein